MFLEDEIFTLQFNPRLNQKFWPALIWIFLAEENLKDIPSGDNGTFQGLSGCPNLLTPTALWWELLKTETHITVFPSNAFVNSNE